jgi:hypothetical protein
VATLSPQRGHDQYRSVHLNYQPSKALCRRIGAGFDDIAIASPPRALLASPDGRPAGRFFMHPNDTLIIILIHVLDKFSERRMMGNT